MNRQRESDVLASVRLAVQDEKCTTFRNNVGSFQNAYGRWVQFGLCPGSSDAIGWTEYKIEPKDVGRTVAIFTAFETKTPHGKKPTDDQARFIGHVQLAGGIAAIARSAHDAIEAIRAWRARGTA